jgi:hypothetical protein
MKGGVTSGIVYPLAVCELAREFRFVNIGGTSAGAIAAAITAAAEYRRMHGDTAGFSALEELPGRLGARNAGGNSMLFSLFQPCRPARLLFDVLLRWPARSKPANIFALVSAMLRTFPGASALGAAGLLALMAIMAMIGRLPSGTLAVLLMVLPSLGLLWLAKLLLRKILHGVATMLARNGFGLCPGFSRDRRPGSAPALTEWLADYLDEIAGKHDPFEPLTFGDLWGAGRGGDVDHRAINLEMVTTNLSHGRPYRLPFDQAGLFFEEAEMRELFPKKIVDWMIRHTTRAHGATRGGGGSYYALPEAGFLPVVVAVRMSLSFPLLISALPLYAVDWSLKKNMEAGALGSPAELERCWFSDGGICSNFPVHFFDSPLPRWPTFDINLRPFHPDFKRSTRDEHQNVWMPRTNRDGILEQWIRFESSDSLASVGAFLETILETMQNWTDNTQLKIPGYRDRIAHVLLEDEEGGLNLNMTGDAIRRLSTRGRIAGEMLQRRFTGKEPGIPLDWDNHRWVRYRSTMTLLERYLHDIGRVYDSPALPGERSYAQLVARPAGSPPPSYRWDSGDGKSRQEEFAASMGAELMTLLRKWDSFGESFIDNTPKPIPILQSRPRI